jgi:hypothetical protein
MPGRDLWAARRPRTRRRRRLARRAGLNRLRPWNRVHLERKARLVAGGPDHLAFHRAGQADAERIWEAFNGRMRDELLDETIFYDLG